MENDWDLLQRYARQRDQVAFAELVKRHVDMVYATARRTLHGPGRGEEDVVQAVFLLLSQKAGRIRRTGTLAGWLFRTTRYCCANIQKIEARRKAREREAAMQTPEATRVAEDLCPLLDKALETLGSKERDAVLARFLERQSAAEAGAALGISAVAAEKRAQRGLVKLRDIFARRGFVVPAAGVASLMVAESVRAAPAGLGLSVASAAGMSGGASTAAVGIAKGAAVMMMKAATMKMALAAALAVIVLAAGAVVVTEKGAGPAAAAAAGTAPARVATEPASASFGPQRQMMARWDVVLNQQGMQRLKKELTAIPTQSQGYGAYEADAEKIREAIKEASVANNLLLLSQRVGWSDMDRRSRPLSDADIGLRSDDLTGPIKLGSGGKILVNVTAGVPFDAAFADAHQDAVRLKIDPEDFTSRVQVSGGPDLGGDPRHMQYQGDVPVGRAVVFMGQWGEIGGTELWHVSVWQAFACGDEEFLYLQHTLPKDWIEAGTAQTERVADRAIAWKWQAKHDLTQVDPKWQKNLPNGSILRLTAVSVPDRWRYCWWDAQGQPVLTDAARGEGEFGDEGAGAADAITVLMEAEDPSVLDRGPGPPDQRRSIIQGWADKEGRVEVGMGGGSWQDGGAIVVGQELEVKGVKVKLVKVVQGEPKMMNRPGTSYIAQASPSKQPDVEIEIAAFDQQGKQIPDDRVPEIYFGRQQMLTYGYPSKDMVRVYAVPADIGSYRVRWRAISWTMFEGFAKLPVVSPDEVVRATSRPRGPADPSSAPAPRITQ